MAVHWIVCCSSVLCVVVHGVLVVACYAVQRVECLWWRVMPYSAWSAYCSVLSITAHGVLIVVYYPLQRMECLL